jgi:hypothetical protein
VSPLHMDSWAVPSAATKSWEAAQWCGRVGGGRSGEGEGSGKEAPQGCSNTAVTATAQLSDDTAHRSRRGARALQLS